MNRPRRKRCRALACQKRVGDDRLFCSVHLPMLANAPETRAIADNKEPPQQEGEERRRKIEAIGKARQRIARLEGRNAQLRAVENQAAGDVDLTEESNDSIPPWKLDEQTP